MLRGVRIRRRRRQVRKFINFHAWIVMVSPWWVPIIRKLNIYAVDISFVNPVGRIGSIPVMGILVFVPCVVKMSGNRPPQRVNVGGNKNDDDNDGNDDENNTELLLLLLLLLLLQQHPR